MENLIRFALQYGTVEIGYSILIGTEENRYDLTREETNLLSLWANEPGKDALREEFRSKLIQSGNHPFITASSDLLSHFGHYFLIISHTDMMNDDEMVSSLNHLIKAFNLSEGFEKEVSMLKILKNLLNSIFTDNVVDLKNDFQKLLDDPMIMEFIFPVFSVGHASYGVCEKNLGNFLVAICNGDLGGIYFHDTVINTNDLGHCIVPDMNRDEINAVLCAVAENYNCEDDVAFAAVSDSFPWKNRKLNANDLAKGKSHNFKDQEVTMSCQTRDNCCLFNLNHALRFARRSFPRIGVSTLNNIEVWRKCVVIDYARRELQEMHPRSGVPACWLVSYDYALEVIEGWYKVLIKQLERG